MPPHRRLSETSADRRRFFSGATLTHILSTRSLAAIGAAFTMMSCAAPATPVDVRARVDLAPNPPVALRIVLRPERARDAARYVNAASSAVRECASAIGRFDAGELTVVDVGWPGPKPGRDTVTLDRVRWWTTATSMAQELAAARGVSRHCWRSALDSSALPPWFVDGLAEFTARRAVVPIFEGVNNPPGYAFLEERYFAAFVPRFVRLRLRAEAD